MIPREIGKIIRAARKDLGLRQDQLAAAANVGIRFVVEIEDGKPSARIGKVPFGAGCIGLPGDGRATAVSQTGSEHEKRH